MLRIDPIKSKTHKLKIKQKNIKNKSKRTIFRVKWGDEDHSDWDKKIKSSKSCVDNRMLNAARYRKVTDVAKAVKGVDWKVTWSKQKNQTELEIFAVIRAEYRFIMGNNWKKLHCKKGATGMDSLFKKGHGTKKVYAIVESKCTKNEKAYKRYISEEYEKSPLRRLGKPQGKKTLANIFRRQQGKNVVRQMSEIWVLHCFLQEISKTNNNQVRDNLWEMWQWMTKKNSLPFRWLNVYGTKELYLVPGVYKVEVLVDGVGAKVRAEEGKLQSDWPGKDGPYKDLEFFALDKATVKNQEGNNPGIEGEWWDFSEDFEKLVRNTEKKRTAKQLRKVRDRIVKLL